MSKIKLLVILPLVLTFSLFASNNLSNIASNFNSGNLKVNSENSVPMNLYEYNKMISTLTAAYELGDKTKAYFLGLAYIQRHVFKDGTINPNINKAMEWFKKGLSAGYGLNSIQIALIEHSKGEIFAALDTLENGLNAHFLDENGRISIAITYGAIVLEKLHENTKYVRKAIDILYPIATRNNLSSLDYTLANLFNLDNKIKLANNFLNSACNNPNVPKEIWQECISGSEIKITDNNTGQIIRKRKNGCPMQQLMPGLGL